MIKRLLKRLFILPVLLLISLVIGVTVLAATWEYYFPTSVQDTSGVARVYYPAFLGYTGQQMVDSGYINANGLDTNMQSGATDIKYMLSTTNVLAVVPNLPAGGQATIDLYTGYAPVQTNFTIITGEGGYITTLDAVALEPTNNFEFVQDGYIDTTGGWGKTLIYKEDAYTTYIDGATNIRSAILGARLWTSPTAFNDPSGVWANEVLSYDGNTATLNVHNAVIAGDTWTEFVEYSVASVDCDGFRVMIDDNGGALVEVDIDLYYCGQWNDYYEGVFLDDGGGVVWNTYDFDAVTADITQVRFRVKSAGGGIGAPFPVIAETDFGEINVSQSVVAAGFASNDYEVKTIADTVNLEIYINSGLEQSVALAGASVPGNVNDWYWMLNDVMAYADVLSEDVGGAPVLLYEPTTMLVANTLPDEEGVAQDGTITWGANTNITLAYGEMESYESMTATSSAEGGFNMPSAPLPGNWFATGSGAANLPFYDSFNSVATQMGMPVQTLYFIAIIGLALGGAVGIIVLTRSAFLGVLVMAIVLFMGSSQTIIPMWIPFVVVIVDFGIMFLYRQVSY